MSLRTIFSWLAVFVVVISQLASFSRQLILVVFHCNLSANKSHQVSRTPLSIFTNYNYTVVCIVSIPPLISCSSSLGNIPSIPTTFGITVTFMFHSLCFLFRFFGGVLFICFFSPLARSKYFFILYLSFIFILGSVVTAKSTKWNFFFCLSLQDWMIRFYLNIQKNFIRLFLKDEF